MIFKNDSDKEKYNDCNLVLQSLVSSFESFCFEYGKEVYLEKVNSNSEVFVRCAAGDRCYDIYDKMISLYPRTDRFKSCSIMDDAKCIFSIYGRSSLDFKNLN